MRPILAAVFAVAALAMLGASADAAGGKRGLTRDTARGKLCVVTGLDNRQVSWKCASSQRCCWDGFANKGSCVAASSACL